MNLQKKVIYAKWLSEQIDKPFVRGEQDCITSFLEMHDTVYGTTALDQVKSKYWDRASAIRFYRNFGLTWRQWLTINKWEQVSDDALEGDIRVVDGKAFPTVYMKHNSYWWNYHESYGFQSYTDTAWRTANYTQWRHK